MLRRKTGPDKIPRVHGDVVRLFTCACYMKLVQHNHGRFQTLASSMGISALKDETAMLPWNIRSWSPSDMSSYPWMETSASLPRPFLSLQTHTNMFTRNLSYTILNHSDNMIKKNSGFDNAEQLPFDSLTCSIFHVLTRCIKYTNDQQTHFNYTDVLLRICCHQQVQGDFSRTDTCYSFIPWACAECDDSLPFYVASSIPLCYILFPATLPYQLFVHPLLPHLAIYFFVYLSILLFPNSNIIRFWEQTHIILFIKLLKKKSCFYILLLIVHSNKTGMPCLKKKTHNYYNCILVLKETKLTFCWAQYNKSTATKCTRGLLYLLCCHFIICPFICKAIGLSKAIKYTRGIYVLHKLHHSLQ